MENTMMPTVTNFINSKLQCQLLGKRKLFDATLSTK